MIWSLVAATTGLNVSRKCVGSTNGIWDLLVVRMTTHVEQHDRLALIEPMLEVSHGDPGSVVGVAVRLKKHRGPVPPFNAKALSIKGSRNARTLNRQEEAQAPKRNYPSKRKRNHDLFDQARVPDPTYHRDDS